jgi:hypothetical protein
MGQDELEVDFNSATDDDTPTDSAVALLGYEKKLSAKERQDAESQRFWSQILAHPVGRRELWQILQQAHAFEERFACGPNGFPQPEATWFHAGEMSLGLRLFLSWQKIDPKGVLLMQQEHDPRFAKPKPPKTRKRGEQ